MAFDVKYYVFARTECNAVVL